MIFINGHAEAILKNGGRGAHVWRQEDIVEDAGHDLGGSGVTPAEVGGRWHPSSPALCGAELEGLPFPGGADPFVQPASEVWADSILTYLNEEDRMCEECRVRAAVYLGLIEDVEVWARTVATDQCGEHNPPVPAEYVIEGVKGEGKVVRRAVCRHPKCGREISRDEVTIPDPERRPFDRR